MKYTNFSLVAYPRITDAFCKCGTSLIEVSNGFLSSVMFCPKCESVYELKLVKVPESKVTEEFLVQSRNEIKNKKGY